MRHIIIHSNHHALLRPPFIFENKGFLTGVLILLVFNLSSCFGSRKTIQPLPPPIAPEPPAIPEQTRIPEPMDTLVLRELDTVNAPVLVEDHEEVHRPEAGDLDGDKTKVFKDEYHVTVLLPFFASDSSSFTSNRVAAWSLDFYLGFKLAFTESDSRGPRFNIQALDTRADDAILQRLISNNKLEDQDVIVGPYRTSLATTVAEYVKDKPTLLVSPYSASTRLGNNNPHYLQLNPSLEAHLRAIWDYLRKKTSTTDRIIFLHGKDASGMAKGKVWSMWMDSLSHADRRRYHLVPFDESAGMELEDIQMDSLLVEQVTNHLVFPSWDESMVQAMMSKISSSLFNKQVRLFGLPQWLDFERIAPSYFRSLDVHVTSADFLNDRDAATQRLQQIYLAKYANPLNDQSAWGYRCGEFVRESLIQDGVLFHRFLAEGGKRNVNPLAPKFVILKEENGALSRIENQNIQILKFAEGRMVPAK